MTIDDRAGPGRVHLDALAAALPELDRQLTRLDDWGRQLAHVLLAGGRLLTCGNGGSAAQAQHLAAELVGRYREDRPPFAALALSSDPSTLTALVNDYGPADIFARQVVAHGRSGDILLALSTSGRSPDMVAAAEVARTHGVTAWAMTGPAPNPLAAAADDALCVDVAETPTVQELHQVAVHLLCAAFEVELARLTS